MEPDSGVNPALLRAIGRNPVFWESDVSRIPHKGRIKETVKKFSFSRNERLRRRRAFEFIFNRGTRTSSRELAMWSRGAQSAQDAAETNIPAEAAGRKLGLVVGKKLGGAVRRNRLKRLLREAFRLSKDGLKDGTAIIVYPKIGCRINTLSQARTALCALWARAKIAK